MIDFFHLISGVHRHHHVQPTMERRHVHNEFLVSLQTLQIKDFSSKKMLDPVMRLSEKETFFSSCFLLQPPGQEYITSFPSVSFTLVENILTYLKCNDFVLFAIKDVQYQISSILTLSPSKLITPG